MNHKFVEFIPDQIEDDVLYISLDYGTVIHKCACGCGNEVNTPLSPAGWQMTYDGRSVTLKPSIGNWSFDCKSHYWITNNKVEWASKWNVDRIEMVREKDNADMDEYHLDNQSNPLNRKEEVADLKSKTNKNLFDWFKQLFF